ncbi:MAG: baseplate J/gp47 family protein, partial [bacterium]
MSTARARLPYINKDYNAIRRELLVRIPQLTDRWTDFNESDLGIVLLELFAGVGDMLAYYLDAQAAECYLPTARRRQSIIDLCALINYRLHGPVAATTKLRFMLAQPAANAVTIPAGTICNVPATGDTAAIPFETMTDVIIPVGQTTVEVDAWQGVRKSDTAIASGHALQRITLSKTEIAYGSVSVSVNGIPWQVVEHFADSGPADNHVRIDRDGLERTTLLFGDNKAGGIPAAGQSIIVSYLVTTGPSGNLAPERITELPTTIKVNGIPVIISVTNPIAATGGAESESHEHARVMAPAVLRSTWKAVTKADYQALCESFPGVAKAQVLDLNDEGSMRIYTVRVVIAPEGGGAPSPRLKADMYAFLEARRMVTIDIFVDEPVYHPVPVSATLYIYTGQDSAQVLQR